jgi:hypothetical protein
MRIYLSMLSVYSSSSWGMWSSHSLVVVSVCCFLMHEVFRLACGSCLGTVWFEDNIKMDPKSGRGGSWGLGLSR